MSETVVAFHISRFSSACLLFGKIDLFDEKRRPSRWTGNVDRLNASLPPPRFTLLRYISCNCTLRVDECVYGCCSNWGDGLFSLRDSNSHHPAIMAVSCKRGSDSIKRSRIHKNVGSPQDSIEPDCAHKTPNRRNGLRQFELI